LFVASHTTSKGNHGVTFNIGGSLNKASRLAFILVTSVAALVGPAAGASALPIPLAEAAVTAYDYNTGLPFAGASGQPCAGIPIAQANTCSSVDPSVFTKGTGTATGSGLAVVQAGLRPSIEAYASITDTSISVDKSGLIVGAGGRFSDNLTVVLPDCGALGACAGTFFAEFIISGVSNWFSPIQDDSGFAEFFISYDEATLGSGSRYSLQTIEPINHDPGTITVLMPGLPFQSGVPFTIQPAFAVQAQMPPLVPAGYEALDRITADYAHSFTLSNVYVVDAAGRAASFAITSESGADYGNPVTSVPEPWTAVTLGSGLLLIAAHASLRRGSRRSIRCSRPELELRDRPRTADVNPLSIVRP
jgi:hypothetical protein